MGMQICTAEGERGQIKPREMVAAKKGTSAWALPPRRITWARGVFEEEKFCGKAGAGNACLGYHLSWSMLARMSCGGSLQSSLPSAAWPPPDG